MADKKEDDVIDLKDADTRKMLHSDSAINKTAMQAGLASGAMGALVAGTSSTILVASDAKKAFKEIDPSGSLPKRLVEMGKKNKLLSLLVAAPAIAAVGAGMYGYFSAKSELKKKQKELGEIEQKEQKTITPNVATEEPVNANEKKWVDIVQSPNKTASIVR